MDDQDSREALFFDRFRCRFPYSDRAAASALIREGQSISHNAAFGVLEEICRRPISSKVGRARQLELLGEWSSGFAHPLKELVTEAAVALIDGVGLPTDTSLDRMRIISQSSGQWAALNIVCFAAYCGADGDETMEAAVDDIDAEVRKRWREAYQIERWRAAGLRIGFDVTAPCKVALSDGSMVEAAALVKVGPSKGMVIDPEWAVLAPHANQLLADGFGYSAVVIDGDDDSLGEMLRDWGWGHGGKVG